MKTCHTATYKGAWVRVKLRNGDVFVDRFVERTRNKRVVFEGRTVRAGDIATFSWDRAVDRVEQRRSQ